DSRASDRSRRPQAARPHDRDEKGDLIAAQSVILREAKPSPTVILRGAKRSRRIWEKHKLAHG
ncbi:MAG: hypothetical protein OXI17_13760, partial [Gammaproteobacteria bacterium]|nr:hypothetical protein [Gammaproteobacteria bacterium]